MKKLIIALMAAIAIFGTAITVFAEGDIPAIQVVKREQDKNGTLKRLIHVYLDENIGSANNYRQLTAMLGVLTANDTVVFKLNTYGGDAYSMIQIYNAIRATKAHTVADVTMAMSAGAVIALACNEIRVNKFSMMMIHSMYTKVSGKIPDIKNTVDHDIKFNNQILREVFKGFLTNIEIEIIISGRELWLCYDELQARVNKWEKWKRKQVKKQK